MSMSAAYTAKQCGFKSLKECAQYAKCTTRWLQKLYKDDREEFDNRVRQAMSAKVNEKLGGD